MRIREIYIKDFGIYNNQVLTDLNPSLVVIGGLNRAGKSTLLEVLRYLGYGFPRGSDLPPARNNYQVEAELVHKERGIINLQLRGYAKPVVNLLSAEGEDEIEVEELYNKMDPFTYHRLFTIDLDELRRIPRGVDNKNRERLQSVLLGAGLKEVLQIPQLEKDFKNKAEKIGGKNGDPKVKEFKPYYRQIKAGIDLKGEALSQVGEYRKKSKRLEEIDEEISRAGKELYFLQSRSAVLDILKNKYKDYSQREKMKLRLLEPDARELLERFPDNSMEKAVRLRDEYTELLKGYNNKLLNFKQSITDNKVDEVREKFLGYNDRLREYNQQLSGLKERVKNFFNYIEDEKRKKDEIDRKLEGINELWKGDYKQVLELKSDKIREDALTRQVERYKELRLEIKSLKKDIFEDEKRKENLQKQLQQLDQTNSGQILKKYFYLAVLFTVSGFGLSYFNIWSGIFGLAGLIGTGLYFLYKYSHLNIIKGQRMELKIELERVSVRIDDAGKELKQLKDDYIPLKRQLEDYCLKLGLDRDSSTDMILYYFREVKNLKRKILDWLDLKDEIKKRSGDLKDQLNPVAEVIEDLGEVIYSKKLYSFNEAEGGNIDNYRVIFNYLERFISYLDLARELDNSKKQKERAEVRIRQLTRIQGFQGEDEDLLEALNLFIQQAERYNELKEIKSEFHLLSREVLQVLQTDRIKKALQVVLKEDIKGDDKILSAFDSLYKNYTSVEDVEKDYSECEEKLGRIKNDLDSLKEKRQTLRDLVKELAAGEKLEKAQKQIIGARADLKPAAERFAVYNTAAFILKKLRKGFLEKTRDKLLAGASYAFKQITGGEYSKIVPVDDLTDADFKTVSKKERSGSTGHLSRGTKEQLFLAVRISRIREIDPPLPVIIDDTLVNFDRNHLGQTVEVLNDLGLSNQIFVLSCHPHLIDAIDNKTSQAQYWKLERGRFEETTAANLIDHLSSGR